MAEVANPHLKALLEALLDDEDVSRRYRLAPAAKQIHHAWLGGLIEHVLSLCALARLTAGHYPHVDYDLLLTGVVLHDIGKIYELNYERGFSLLERGAIARPHPDRDRGWWATSCGAFPIFRPRCGRWWST